MDQIRLKQWDLAVKIKAAAGDRPGLYLLPDLSARLLVQNRGDVDEIHQRLNAGLPALLKARWQRRLDLAGAQKLEPLRLWGAEMPLFESRADESLMYRSGFKVCRLLGRQIRTPRGLQSKRAALTRDFYCRELADRAYPLLGLYLEQMGLDWCQLEFRPLTAKLGCLYPESALMVLNCRLAGEDPRLLEAVLVHELCHFFEPRHNRRFYALWERFCPWYAGLDYVIH